MLRHLLSKLEEQITEDLFNYSIVIVDNDSSGSARQIVESFAYRSAIPINYCIEPEQNISLARNKAIENAKGDLFAMIDDDEFPNEDWLLTLYKALKSYKSDGILGPVLPHFEEKPPGWVLQGHFFDRETHRSGHVLDWENTRTGNAMIRRELFKYDTKWFDPQFGSGGEDRDFFKRKMSEGYVFTWCNEAPVFEVVLAERWNKTVLIKRAFLRGKMSLYATRSRYASVFRSLIAIMIYAICLPISIILGYHVFMTYLIKSCDHLGKLFAFIGIDLVKEKYVSGQNS